MADDDNADAQNQCVLCGGKETLMMFQPSGFYYNNSEPRTQNPTPKAQNPKLAPAPPFGLFAASKPPLGKERFMISKG